MRTIMRCTLLIRRMKCRMVLDDSFSRSLNVIDASSGYVSRSLSLSMAKVGKTLWLHSPQPDPSSHRVPSFSGRSLCDESSNVQNRFGR